MPTMIPLPQTAASAPKMLCCASVFLSFPFALGRTLFSGTAVLFCLPHLRAAGTTLLSLFYFVFPCWPRRVQAEHSRWYQPYGSRGVGAATDLSQEERRLVWLTAFRAASHWAFSLLLSMSAVAEFGTAEQDCGWEAA